MYFCIRYWNKYMKLYIFNPEHDIALASGLRAFTAPHAGRQLRADLAFLPSIWAEDGDIVLVDDVDNALEQARHLKSGTACVTYISREDLEAVLCGSNGDVEVFPWGWDASIKHQLLKDCNKSICNCLVPSDNQIERIREISNRRWAANNLCNTGVYCTSLFEVKNAAESFGRFVMKAPWSSSGRGIRYRADWRWAESVIRRQGGVMVEPYYNKVKDFGMEFYVAADGTIIYQGLSLFETVNGAYTGNLLAGEDEKVRILSSFIQESKLDEARRHIIDVMGESLRGIYNGPFGVDMMVYVDDGEFHLLPCVELNLRMTMGHVALALTRRVNPTGVAPHQLMRIEYDGHHYHFRVLNTQSNALNTSLI